MSASASAGVTVCGLMPALANSTRFAHFRLVLHGAGGDDRDGVSESPEHAAVPPLVTMTVTCGNNMPYGMSSATRALPGAECSTFGPPGTATTIASTWASARSVGMSSSRG